MSYRPLASVTIHILSTNNDTWQGLAETDTAIFSFQSELELLGWLCKQYPCLIPNTDPQANTFQEVF